MSNQATFIPELKTDRLLLVPLGLSHSAGMFELWSSADVCRHSGLVTDIDGSPIQLPAESVDDSDKIIKFWVETAARIESVGFRWALTMRDTGDFVGIAGFNAIRETAEYAYHLLPRYWGMGIMFEASGAALGWVRDRSDCSELEAFIEPENTRSAALVQRLGFVPTDVFVAEAQRFSMPISGPKA